MSSAEFQLTVERSNDGGLRKLTQPERAERLKKQQDALVGPRIEGRLEPADKLVDRAVSQYEDNRLSYIDLHKCIHKEQEIVCGGSKEDRQMSIDASGVVKVKDKDLKLEADLSSDMLIRQAMMRRGLAYDQANIMSYLEHEKWVERVFEARIDSPPEGYARISHQQIINADRKHIRETSRVDQDGHPNHRHTQAC